MTILLMIKIPGKVPCEISLMNSMRQPVCQVWIAKIYEPKEMHAQNEDIKSLTTLLIWINICYQENMVSAHFPCKSWAEIRLQWRFFPVLACSDLKKAITRHLLKNTVVPAGLVVALRECWQSLLVGMWHRDRRLLLLTQGHVMEEWSRQLPLPAQLSP